MKLTIEPTEQFFMAGEVMVRMWHGQTADGEPVIALVSCVTFTSDAPASVAKGLGLVSIPPPTEAEARRWAEKIMTA